MSAAACIVDRIFCQRYKRLLGDIISAAVCIADKTFIVRDINVNLKVKCTTWIVNVYAGPKNKETLVFSKIVVVHSRRNDSRF